MTVTPGSLAARVLGCTELGVNTLHHQAVDRVGEGLVVVGTAEDGMVEAIEADDGAPVLGVQWHPELLVAHECATNVTVLPGASVEPEGDLIEADIAREMAGSLLGSVPVAIIYSFFVEYYVSSMTGAVKE